MILFMEKCNLVIGGDSGPVHLAELTDTKAISLFGPTNEIMWGTPKSKGITIKKENIKDISVHEVKKIIQKFI